ncbi:MAG TPA: hypothetical protein VIM13_08485, partial [Clostridia bacterium]
MKRLLSKATTFILMTAMLITLASANACASDRDPAIPASSDGNGSFSNPAASNTLALAAGVTGAVMKSTAVMYANPVLANNSAVNGKTDQSSSVSAKKEMRGLWVATVVNIDYPSKPTTDPEVLKKEAVEILDNAKNTGLNAVFLQVRPTADAF